MKKVLIGGFVAESNQHVSHQTPLEKFVLKYGDDVARSLYIDELAKEHDIELVPSLYADGRGGGIVKKDAFDYIQKVILNDVKKHYRDVDAIFMFIHGASQVEEYGSGDHELIKNIRKIVGDYLPIVIVSDPHGNITENFTKHTTIHRTFRHSPHTDRAECHHFTFKLLVDLLENRQNIRPEIAKIPVMLGGERSVSTDEPMVTINAYLDELERDERLLSVSLFIGYVRHDSDKCGAAVVVPSKEEYQEYAQEVARKVHNFMIDKATSFRFHGEALELDESLENAFNSPQGPIYITDSGDNCTAGAAGYDTHVLREVLKRESFNGKKVLFSCIADPNLIMSELNDKVVGDEISVELGMNINEYSRPVHLEGKVVAIGRLFHHYGDGDSIGACYTVKVTDKDLYVVIAEHAVSFAEKRQYDMANLDWNDYDLMIVKQGYLYPDLKARAEYYVMALTDGATNQRTERLNYKLIRRPMYPYDQVEKLKKY